MIDVLKGLYDTHDGFKIFVDRAPAVLFIISAICMVLTAGLAILQ